MKTVKAQKDEGLKSTRDCKEVTQNGGARERSRFMDGAVCIFSARLDYVTLDLTNVSTKMIEICIKVSTARSSRAKPPDSLGAKSPDRVPSRATTALRFRAQTPTFQGAAGRLSDYQAASMSSQSGSACSRVSSRLMALLL
jgi:hypothetical protein